MKWPGGVLLLLLVGLLASCTSIPEQELTRYVQAFTQAECASKLVLAEAETDLRVVLGRKATRADDLTKLPEFDPRKTTGVGPDEQIRAREEVWVVLRSYVRLLTSLAAGSDQLSLELRKFVSTTTDVVATVANAAYPGAGTLIGLLKAPIEALIRLIAAERFKEAVGVADKLVSDLVQLMIDDTKSFYHLKEVNVLREIDAENGDLLAQHKVLMSRLRGVTLPTDSDKRRALKGDVEAIASVLESAPLSPDADKADKVRKTLVAPQAARNKLPEISESALADVAKVRSWFEQYHERCGVRRERLVAYISVLTAYVRALDTMRTAHAALAAAAETRQWPDPANIKGAFDVVHTAWKQYEAVRK